jgi:hypothetical protein
MSAGSNNSNFGYAKLNPYGSNVNPEFVNKWSSNNPANFSSNEIYRGSGGLFGAVNNVNAAAGVVPGIGLFKGGANKKLKSKIKNITKRYRRNMHKNKRSAKRHVRSIKSRIRAKYGGRRNKSTRTSRRHSHRRRHRTLRGGYSQYQNNFPFTPSYSVGGVLSASNSALANPPPVNQLPNCVNCVDNYSHFTGKGFASPGH